MAPLSARAAADRIGHQTLFRGHAYGWGWSYRYNPLSGEGTASIAAVVASITVDEAAIERRGYRHGVGAPRGETIRQLRLDLDDWRARFVDWVSLIAGQAVSPLTPPVPDLVRSEADGTVVWVEDPDLVGVPSTSSSHVIVQDQPEDESAGFLLDRDMLERIRQLVDTREQPTTQLRLLRSARVAIRRGEHRLALVELGSAAELCLWKLYDTPTPRSTPQQRQSWTLGTLVGKLYPPTDPQGATLRTALVDPRNNTITALWSPTVRRRWRPSRWYGNSSVTSCRLHCRPSSRRRDGGSASVSPCQTGDLEHMFVSWVVTGATGSSTPGSHPIPNPTRGPASPGGNSPPGTGPGPGLRRSAAPSCSRRPDCGSRTCGSKTRPASHPLRPWAGSTRSRRRRWRRTRCGRPADG